jgi:hypothetical protein
MKTKDLQVEIQGESVTLRWGSYTSYLTLDEYKQLIQENND